MLRVWGIVVGAAALLIAAAGSGGTAEMAVRSAAARPPQAAPAPPGHPLPEMRIAAVVNDEVISVFDLVSRMRMIMLSSNIQDTPENRQKLAAQVLRSLIDERLELQEAKRQGVSASDAEIKDGLEQIEKQNNMQSGQLNEFLKARGIDRSSLLDQLTASIEWAKLIRRKASETVEISDEEIDDAIKRVKAHEKDPESRVAEIFLAVDNPSQDQEVRGQAERLIQQMRQGARFSAVARQFSKSATAAVGGDLGYVRPDQLPPAIGKEVAQLKVGELSPPIRAAGGYYLLLVIDRRNGNGTEAVQEETYDIVQVVFPLPARAGEGVRRAAIAEAESIRNAAKDCPTLLKIGKEKAPQLSSEGHLPVSRISPGMRKVLDGLAIGHPSQPIVQRNGVGIVMLCGKTKPGQSATAAKTPKSMRQEVTESLIAQRLDTIARQYLHDLRRNAYVDVRV